MSGVLIPNIVATVNGREQSTNSFSYDFEKNRVIYLNGEVDDLMAASIVSQLRYLDSKSHEDIFLLINSPGGSVSAGFMIFDCMKYGVHSEIVTWATGMAASMGAFLLCAGAKGKRYATQNCQIMLHQPIGGVQGQATDISVVAEHIQDVKKCLASIIAEETGQSLKKVLRDTERDNWLNSKAAKEYGLIDKVGDPTMETEVKYEY